MAWIDCPECGKPTTDRTALCTHCGKSIVNKKDESVEDDKKNQCQPEQYAGQDSEAKVQKFKEVHSDRPTDELIPNYVESKPAIRGPWGPWGPWAGLGWTALILLISQIVGGFIGLIIVLVSTTNPSSPVGEPDIEQILLTHEGLLQSIVGIISIPIVLLAVFGLIKWRKSESIQKYLALAPAKLWPSLIWIFVIVAWALGSDFLLDAIAPEASMRAEEGMISMYKSAGWLPLLWVAIAVGAPLIEESLFRGFLYRSLEASRVKIIGAIFIPAAIWALIHVQYPWQMLIQIFVAGILLGLTRSKTGSLLPCLAAHCIWNLISMVQTHYHLSQ